jgi:succinoglycan biosynthesis protein ExoA
VSDVRTVTVVIPALQAAATLDSAVCSALAQDWPRLEVVIAVGPSGDDTRQVAEALATADPRVSVIDNPSGSTGAGLNAAIKASRGAVVVRLDAHAELPPGYIRRAVELLDETGAANVGGVQRAVGHTTFEQAVAAAMTSKLGTGDAKFHYGGAPGPVDTVYLGAFRREVLDRLGGFDRSLLRNQDYELNYRIRQDGEVVWFDPSLQVSYRPRSSPRALARQYFDYGRWKREVVRRHPGSLKLRQVIPPLALVANVAGLALGLRDQRALAIPVAYGAVVLGVSAQLGRGLPVRSAAWLPVTFPVMHGAWGVGFFVGPPRRAITSPEVREGPGAGQHSPGRSPDLPELRAPIVSAMNEPIRKLSRRGAARPLPQGPEATP